MISFEPSGGPDTIPGVVCAMVVANYKTIRGLAVVLSYVCIELDEPDIKLAAVYTILSGNYM